MNESISYDEENVKNWEEEAKTASEKVEIIANLMLAIRNQDINTIECYIERGVPLTKSMMTMAAMNKSPFCMRYLIRKHCPFDEELYKMYLEKYRNKRNISR